MNTRNELPFFSLRAVPVLVSFFYEHFGSFYVSSRGSCIPHIIAIMFVLPAGGAGACIYINRINRINSNCWYYYEYRTYYYYSSLQ
jgi:hypothetical protein